MRKKNFSILISFQLAALLIELVKDSGLQIELGLVQTAYANGSSTNYINNNLVSDHKIHIMCFNSAHRRGIHHINNVQQNICISAITVDRKNVVTLNSLNINLCYNTI